MSKYKVAASSRFKRDVKRLTRRGYNIEILKGIVLQLADGKTLPPKTKTTRLRESGQNTGNVMLRRIGCLSTKWIMGRLL